MRTAEESARILPRHLHEECGVFGIFAPQNEDLAGLVYYGLYALQHRGQESAGIAINDDGVFSVWRDVGLVSEALPARRLEKLGRWAMCAMLLPARMLHSTRSPWSSIISRAVWPWLITET